MIYVLEVRERAVGKGRPRINTITHTAYTPEKTRIFENKLKLYFKKKYGRPELSENPFSVKIKVEIEPPKSTSQKKAQQLYGKPFTKKPDIDNIIKCILDAFNKLVYKDDNQIYKIEAEKVYGIKDRTIIILEELI